jgi:hypothetical protein
MTGSRRLLIWLGAGAIIVTGAPAAYATGVVQTAGVQTAAVQAAGLQPRDSAPCGFSPQDFAGGFRDAQYPEVGCLFDLNGRAGPLTSRIVELLTR